MSNEMRTIGSISEPICNGSAAICEGSVTRNVTRPEPKYVQDALNWCNARRKEKGKKPLKRLPRGKRKDAQSCPCGAATGFSVSIGAYWVIGNVLPVHPLPSKVQRFVKAFDAGKLPQYEA